MTGTACDVYEYDENETSCLNNFDLFSLYLFEKINKDHLRGEDSLGYESNFKGRESKGPDLVIIDGGLSEAEGL